MTRLLYVTPEYCQTETFRRSILTVHQQGELTRVAIDEAHCVSEWGHDFRPAYKALSWFRRELKNPIVPMTALTATATSRVRNDIITLLGLDPGNLKRFSTSSSRPNIHYEVKYIPECAYDLTVPEDSQIDHLISWLRAIHKRRLSRLSQPTNGAQSETVAKDSALPPMSGIIYVPLRALCCAIASILSSCTTLSIKAVSYHAGLPATERERIQSMWSAPHKNPSKTTAQTSPAFYIVVATNAFGMGIDNSNVRFVVHWTPPRTFESFVQESGRAGRDGCAAISLVYYNPSECIRIIDRIRQTGDFANETVRLTRKRTFENLSAAEIRAQEEAKIQNTEAILQSFAKVVKYCETTDRCRHAVIQEFSDDLELELARERPKPSSQIASGPVESKPTSVVVCDYACDHCKEGPIALGQRKKDGLKHPNQSCDGEMSEDGIYIKMSLINFMESYMSRHTVTHLSDMISW